MERYWTILRLKHMVSRGLSADEICKFLDCNVQDLHYLIRDAVEASQISEQASQAYLG
ncbi:MAG: hypothetical protein WCO52_03975 [bacterium]